MSLGWVFLHSHGAPCYDAEEATAKAQDLEQEEPNKNKSLEYAMQVCNFYDPYSTLSSTVEDVYVPLLSPSDSKIRLVLAGMNFSFATMESNLPYVWGKNCVPNPQYDSEWINLCGKPMLDSTHPRFVPDLPKHERIIKVACGTHHAAVLLEDGSVYAVGVATDRPMPMWNRFVEILPPSVVDVSFLISFMAGFDRTFVVYGDELGERHVVEIQLWSEEEMRLNGSVRPSWVDWLEDIEEGRRKKVKEVRRGWMHTVILTEDY